MEWRKEEPAPLPPPDCSAQRQQNPNVIKMEAGLSVSELSAGLGGSSVLLGVSLCVFFFFFVAGGCSVALKLS